MKSWLGKVIKAVFVCWPGYAQSRKTKRRLAGTAPLCRFSEACYCSIPQCCEIRCCKQWEHVGEVLGIMHHAGRRMRESVCSRHCRQTAC